MGKLLFLKIINKFGTDGLYFNCEEEYVKGFLQMGKPELFKSKIGKVKIVVLDEAQTVENIGKILKVIFDTYPEIQIIATGSSSFELANKINEPLTGRISETFFYKI